MGGYILYIRNKYNHLPPNKPQYSPHKHCPIDYGPKQQIVQPADTSPYLDGKGIKIVQGIVGALIYVGISVNKKLLVALSTIGSQQSSATEETEDAIEQLLDYVTTYPDNGILFRKIDIILAVHSEAGFLPNLDPVAEQAPIYFSQKTTQRQNSMSLC